MIMLKAAFAVSIGLAAASAGAADTGARTYPNPSCTDRTANPADCVIQDGDPRRPPPLNRRGPGGTTMIPPAPPEGKPPAAAQPPGK